MQQELPTPRELRRRIELVDKESYRNALKFAWLGLCRVSEIVGKAYDSDKGTTARGPSGDSFDTTEYNGKDGRVPVVLFTVNTSKRGGLPRTAAYPLDREYEPWAVELYRYFQKFDPGEKVFPFTRQKLWQVSRDAFSGLSYPIEEYNRIIEESELRDGMQIVRDHDGGGVVVKIMKHRRVLGTHAIRHIKAVDLMSVHGFTVQELSVIGGWTLRSMTGASGAIARYAHLDWQSYFPKMLVKRYQFK